MSSRRASGKKVVCVIPARLGSTRLPEKVLLSIKGKPMIQWVWEAALSSLHFDEVYFAIDDEKTARLIDSFDGRFVMTSPDCASGTARIIDFRTRTEIKADVWVNWQADEPFLPLPMINDLLQGIDHDGAAIWTLKKSLTESPHDPHIVKVVTNHLGRALYFSRSPIPYNKEGCPPAPLYKHIGLYAYSDSALTAIARLPPSPLAEAESLEQLAFLEHALPIQVYSTQYDSLSINTPEDLLSH